jgi:hypothetical protein
MTGVLISFNLASLLLLGYVFFEGYQVGGSSLIRTHITLGLAVTGLLVFSQCMTMMYAAAVGRMIRQAVEQGQLNLDYVRQAKQYRAKIFRIGTAAMLIMMLHTILGGGAHTRAFSPRIHEYLAIFTLFFVSAAVTFGVRYLIYSHLLGHKVAMEFELKKSREATIKNGRNS